jgi:hypothetical protein
MFDGTAKDYDTWNGLKQAVGGTICKKCVFSVLELIDEQYWKCANTFDPDCKQWIPNLLTIVHTFNLTNSQ